MGMLSSFREDRAGRRAHVKALKSRAKLEARLAAKETRSKAREAHRIALTTAKEQAKQAREIAVAEAKDARKAAQQAVRRTEKAAEKQATRLRKAQENKGKHTARSEKAHLAVQKKEARLASRQRKEEKRIAEAGRKHERVMAAAELDKIEAGRFGRKDVKRWIDVAKTAAPVLAPLIYKGITSQQGRLQSAVSAPGSAGPAAALGARIRRLESSVDQLESHRSADSSVVQFVGKARTRLTDLAAAVESAETMPTAQRRAIHTSISSELDRVNRDVLARLGVKA